MKHSLTILLFFLLCAASLSGQTTDAAIRLALGHLKSHSADFGITPSDAAEALVSSAYQSKKSGVTHVYFSQTYQGIEVLGAAGNANINREGALINMNVRFVRDVAGKVSQTTAALSAEQAVFATGKQLGIALPASLPVAYAEGGPMQKITFAEGDYALEPISARLAYHADEALGLRLVWEVNFFEKNGQHHWNTGVDAMTGNILFQRDMVVHCDFGAPHEGHTHYAPRSFSRHLEEYAFTGSGYNVFPMPVESPNHGDRVIVTDPADPIASPFGWHDLNGIDGADTTITMGNNVHAYQDSQDLNGSSGDEPDGGPDLLFDFPYEINDGPESYRDAAVTNLFYWCNIMHDVWYQYGFDEPAGNFQLNNYGNGGAEGDYIRAEAQDGSGTNNANFSSSADGTNARIQMYLWEGGGMPEPLMTIDTPSTLAGSYLALEATFGPGLPTDVPLTGELVLVDDGSANPTLGCGALVNATAVNGKIALVDRGSCVFVNKIQNAQDAGAIAVIVCNNIDGPPTAMPGNSASITIPSIMISKADCDLIKVELANGINVSLLGTGTVSPDRDGDFDSGIVCHEYGHGVSIRLTGGPGTGGCLNNAEQMGEGWSDYIGLMLTMEEGDLGNDIRGIGTFAIFQNTDGVGIRPAPYCTDFAVNPYTYAATNDVDNISQPHGVGFVWATMLWDMTWLLIDQYGFDPDFYNGTGGNNIAMQLVTEGMKLQPCNPGFVDGRDAILLADQILYGGANQCLIWEAFAKRGLGKSASQGSSGSRTDQVEAFDLPNVCIVPDFPPSAGFNIAFSNECAGQFVFDDQSSDVPQSWLWSFGDGNTSTEENPSHTYVSEGSYEVSLIVTNTLGSDTATQIVNVDFIDAPVVENATGCEGQPATLTALDNGYDINWYENGELVFTGAEFVTPPLAGAATYFVQSEDKKPLQQVGPADNSFGPGGYHNTGFTGTVIFEAHVPFILDSVWVDAGSAGMRTIELFDMDFNTLSSVEVFIPQGQSMVALKLEVPAPGMYQVGGTTINLYRNNGGAQYPYDLEGIVTLTGSPSPTNPTGFYYYLYNWKVRELSCFSEQVEVTVEVEAAPEANFGFAQQAANFEFFDASNGATSWSWNFGDGNTSTQQNPAHTYTADGTYEVMLIAINGACQDTIIRTVEVFGVGTQEIPGLNAFAVTPTLGNGQFTVTAALQRPAELELRVLNALGQAVYQYSAGEAGYLEKAVNISGLAPGAYFVQLRAGGEQAVRRYVMVR
ncbi:MAG: T9SS-dependent M36 family metallopeptidase [Saprospiraceae bacterium]